MQKVKLYQTVSFYNLQGKESSKIICSSNEDAWLGKGFYFWEQSFQHAKWWGRRHCHDEFIIFESAYDYDSKKYFDLIGNPIHRGFIEEAQEEFYKKYHKNYRIGEVIELLKKIGEFNYEAVRAYPIPQDKIGKYIPFEDTDSYVFERYPRFQICIIEPSFLICKPKIIYKNRPYSGYI